MEDTHASSIAFLSLRSSKYGVDVTKTAKNVRQRFLRLKQRKIYLQWRKQILKHRLEVEHVETYLDQVISSYTWSSWLNDGMDESMGRYVVLWRYGTVCSQTIVPIGIGATISFSYSSNWVGQVGWRKWPRRKNLKFSSMTCCSSRTSSYRLHCFVERCQCHLRSWHRSRTHEECQYSLIHKRFHVIYSFIWSH